MGSSCSITPDRVTCYGGYPVLAQEQGDNGGQEEEEDSAAVSVGVLLGLLHLPLLTNRRAAYQVV